MKDLIIVGAGGLGREVLQWAKDCNRANECWNIKGFINDIPDALDGLSCSHPIIGSIENWEPADNEVFACAIADPEGKHKVTRKLKSRGAVFCTVIHPTAIVGEHNTLGEGLLMYPYSRVTANCTIGNFVTILSSGIGHDVQIGDYTTISSYCTIAGHVRIGEKVFVGNNSTLIPKTLIEDNVFIGAGSVVVSNLKKGSRVMGNPARNFTPGVEKK